MELNINFIAVAVCVLLSFILGFVWYAALFMKPWTKEMGYDPNMRPDKKQMMKKGGVAKKMASGGLSSGHKSADGMASKGRTKGKDIVMKRGGMAC